MHGWSRAAIAGLVIACAGCGEGSTDPAAASPDAVLAAFFDDDLVRCERDSDCLAGVCDLTPVFTFSVSGGYCVGFPGAFERWQRVLLARKLADLIRADPALAERVWSRLADESRFAVRGEEKELLLLVPALVGTPEAMEQVRDVYRQGDSGLRTMAGLYLAASNPGSDEGVDRLVEASASSVDRLRMHAAWAAGQRCDRTGLGILADLLRDRSALVRQAAGLSVERCPAADARPLLEARRAELDTGEGRTGDRFVVESALDALAP
jgi:hypothetical protein